MNSRPLVDIYSHNMWTHIFSTFSLDNQEQNNYAQGIEEMKKKVKIMLGAASSTLDKNSIILIDTIERLGLAYHFETEIEEMLQQIHNFHANNRDDDLFTVALGFRMLRQHQYHVSSSVFEKFTDKDKKFLKSLSNDVEGLLSLYEAANVQISGEEILDEGLVFAVNNLKRMLHEELESSALHKVNQALEQPLHKGMPVLQSRRYISIYQKDHKRDELLLTFAKFNFNYLQNLYKNELSQLLRWWKDFEVESKLPFVRDRVTEIYFWSMAFRFEPQYSIVRLAITKCMQMMTIMDDTYDNYATVKEANLFTRILERWDMDEIDQLPDCLKVSYQIIMRINQDFEREAVENGTSFALPYFKDKVIQFGRAYNQELKWLTEKRIPSYEDYLPNSVTTSGTHVIFTALLPSMESLTKETIDWVLSDPKILVSTAKMVRLLNDLASHERESKGGDAITLVDCRMKYQGLSKEEILSKLSKEVEDGWKDLNNEWVLARTSGVPKNVVEQLLNFTRGTQVIYKKNDGITYPQEFLAPLIITLLRDPIHI
uniref:Terpene synthase 5 n=1 Tax=Scutellaria barbata TaxID=396367 RepID=A0A6B7LVC3_9LAMI|nr:terpene synthase 5 [Scutellaria barbata]